MAGLFDGTALERSVTCVVCGHPMADCDCPKDGTGRVCRPSDQAARVWREKRRGKWVTVVTGLDPQATDLKALARKFKMVCSAGGTVAGDRVEVQGDHRERLVKMLRGLGYPAKAVGG